MHHVLLLVFNRERENRSWCLGEVVPHRVVVCGRREGANIERLGGRGWGPLLDKRRGAGEERTKKNDVGKKVVKTIVVLKL